LSKRYSLVIQGPILDRGFNCSDSISKVLRDFGHIFNQVVISTWEGQSKHLSLETSFSAEVIENRDPFSTERPWPDNRLRQWVSSLNGIDKVNEGSTHVVKIRTDQYFDLSLFLREYEENCRQNNDYLARNPGGFIHALALYRRLHYALCDFALVGPKSSIRDFYFAQVKFRDTIFTRSIDIPEVDSVRKYLFHTKDEFDFEIPKALFMPNIPSSLEGMAQRTIRGDQAVLALWEFALRQIFSVSSRDVIRNLEWRGSLISQDYVSDTFACRDEWLKRRQTLVLRQFSDAVKKQPTRFPNLFLHGRRRASEGDRGILTRFLIVLMARHLRHDVGSIFWGKSSAKVEAIDLKDRSL
jgi:WavE lipopolysaccharide synthesis